MHIGNDKCTRCGGGSRPCPVCNPVSEPRQRDADIQSKLAEARNFIESMVNINGPYPYLNKKSVIADAYAVLRNTAP